METRVDEASKHPIAGVVSSGKQFLMPLETERKGLCWDLNRLDYAVVRTGAGNNRWGQLADGFAMKCIDENGGLPNQGEQSSIWR